MAERIHIPKESLDTLMKEVDNLTEEELSELGAKYQKSLTVGYNASPEAKAKSRLREAIRRKKMRLVVDKAIEAGLLEAPEKKARGRQAA